MQESHISSTLCESSVALCEISIIAHSTYSLPKMRDTYPRWRNHLCAQLGTMYTYPDMSSCGTQSSILPIAEAARDTFMPVCRAISSRSRVQDTSRISAADGTLPNRAISSALSGSRTFGPVILYVSSDRPGHKARLRAVVEFGFDIILFQYIVGFSGGITPHHICQIFI